MRAIGEKWAAGAIGVAREHLASGVVSRVIARLGAGPSPRGRRKGTAVVSAPPGEHHGLPTAIVADLLRLARFHVVDLGADCPASEIAAAAAAHDRVVGVGICATSLDDTTHSSIADVVRLVHERTGTPVLLGGATIPWPGTPAPSAETDGPLTRPRPSRGSSDVPARDVLRRRSFASCAGERMCCSSVTARRGRNQPETPSTLLSAPLQLRRLAERTACWGTRPGCTAGPVGLSCTARRLRRARRWVMRKASRSPSRRRSPRRARRVPRHRTLLRRRGAESVQPQRQWHGRMTRQRRSLRRRSLR